LLKENITIESPAVYDELSEGTHEFIVRAWDAGDVKSGVDEFTWTVSNPSAAAAAAPERQ
jgi:hypothetical protein